jgi:GNAT superfamily N-acetyltransferase
MDTILTLTDEPGEEFHELLSEGLNSHNHEQAGYADRRSLGVIVSDAETGKPIGGVLGRTSFGLLFIDLVYLPEALRGRDIGRRIIEMAEMEARRRGCRSAVLYTISFQAPRFYEKLGWRVFGEIPCDPPGTSRVFMTKTLRD